MKNEQEEPKHYVLEVQSATIRQTTVRAKPEVEPEEKPELAPVEGEEQNDGEVSI